MSINPSNLSGQFAAEVYNELLNIVRRESRAAHHPPRRQQWSFRYPERSPQAEAAIRAYWGELFKNEIEALDLDWATPRQPALIADSLEGDDVSIQQAG
jgi:hypothetical protein